MMRDRDARRTTRRRILAGIVGVSVLTGVGSIPTIRSTDALFLDTEVLSATFTSFTVPIPAVTGCTVTQFLGTFTSFTITWTSPYVKAQQRLSINDVEAPLTTATQSGTGPYSYSMTISSGLLGTLLTGGLLGATNTVKVQALLAGTTWISTPATMTLSIGGLLGLGGNNTCT